MATKRKGTMDKVGAAVKKAAKKVVKTADQYVAEPVSKALGLKTKTKTAKRPASKKSTTVKSAASKSGKAKTGSTKKASAKRPARST